MSSEVFTIGELADILKQPPARINYIISRDRLKPAVRIANIRLFDEVAIERIRLALAGIHSKTCAGKIDI